MLVQRKMGDLILGWDNNPYILVSLTLSLYRFFLNPLIHKLSNQNIRDFGT